MDHISPLPLPPPSSSLRPSLPWMLPQSPQPDLPCLVLHHLAVSAAKVSLLNAILTTSSPNGNSLVGPISRVIKPTVHTWPVRCYLICLTLSLIACPLPSAIAALASLVLLGNTEPCSDLRAFALSVPAWGSALFYTLPSQANIPSSERSSLTTSSLPSNSHFIFLAPWQVLKLIQACFICMFVYYLLK